MGTVLVVGSTGNIGVSVIIASLRLDLHVIAVVRNAASAEKILKHTGVNEAITIVEADVTSEEGVQGVVDRVKEGKLPAFNHVYSAVGVFEPTTPIHMIPMPIFRQTMKVNVEANFFAYRATIPYLLSLAPHPATFTLITGGAGELGLAGVTSVSQGALFSLANVGSLELRKTNVRFNEVYLCYRVDFDDVVDLKGDEGTIRVSEFARVYEGLIRNEAIRGSRISVKRKEDLEPLKWEKKLDEENLWYST